jgi:hypothetical protein
MFGELADSTALMKCRLLSNEKRVFKGDVQQTIIPIVNM